MTDDTLSEALASLRTQRDDVAVEVETLSTGLRDAQARLAQLERAIEGLAPFVGGDIAILADEEGMPDETPDEMPDETPRDKAWQPSDQVAAARKKWPSTAMVAELINDLGRPIRRDEIIAAFDERFGLPATWANPRNTLGNALHRAWDAGTIERLDQNYFAPRGHQGALPRGGQ